MHNIVHYIDQHIEGFFEVKTPAKKVHREIDFKKDRSHEAIRDSRIRRYFEKRRNILIDNR